MDGLALKAVTTINAQKIISLWHNPMLLVRSNKDKGTSSLFQTPDSALAFIDTHPTEETEPLENYLDPDSLLIPLLKGSRNDFSKIITIGRAQNNDICLCDNTLSKVHGWFLIPSTPNGSWQFVDNHSTNGTVINRMRIPSHHPITLKTSDEIILGQISALFVGHDEISNLIQYFQAEQTKKHLGYFTERRNRL